MKCKAQCLPNCLFVLIMLFVVTGCQNTPYFTHNNQVLIKQTMQTDDLVIVTKAMVNDLLSSNTAKHADYHSVLFIDYIKNQTSHFLDTKKVTAAIIQEISTSNKFILLSHNEIKTARQTFGYAINNNISDPSLAIQFGQHIQAQYMIYGEIISQFHMNNKKNPSYTLILRLMNLNTGIIEWTSQKQIYITK